MSKLYVIPYEPINDPAYMAIRGTDHEAHAEYIASDPARLLWRLNSARECLIKELRIPLANCRYSFAERRLYLADGYYLQWKLRTDPDAPVSYANQQTSIGAVEICHDSALKGSQ